jgi:hypothetical protein
MSDTCVITPVALHMTDERKIRSAARDVYQADVKRRGHGVIAGVRRFVARSAETIDRFYFQDIVQAGHPARHIACC